MNPNPVRTFDLLDRCIDLYPNRRVLAEKTNGQWIYHTSEDYHEIARQFAWGLLELGFRKGDKIVTITNNRPQWNFVDLGMAMAGVVHVPVYTSLNFLEYSFILEHSDARMVIVSDKKLHDMVMPACRKLKKVEWLFTFNEVEGASNWTEVLDTGKKSSDRTRQKLESIKKEIVPDDFASLIYTSGTTGTAKGVMLSHRNLVGNFLAAAGVFRLTKEDRYLSILPLCHVGGRMGNYQTQYSGACIYYAESMGTIAENLKEIRATGFDAVPRILEKIYDNVLARGRSLKGMKKKIFFWAVGLGLRYAPFGEKSWFYYRKLKIADRLIFSKWREALGGHARIVGCGGASLQPRLERIFWASGLKILNMYGLTETSPIITINRQDLPLCKLGTVGALIDGVELKIADDGEICCRGHNVMLGYYKDELLTNSVLDEEGWFHTGDVGHLENGTFLHVTDRKKEIFKLSSGKFIAPQLLENRIKESLFVDQVMVVGEHQKFASALLVPNFTFLKDWCLAREIPIPVAAAELVCHPEVVSVYQEEISKINRTLAVAERIQRIRIVPDEWSPQSGELSASLKLRRKVLEDKYRELLDSIYRRQS
ncbi:MAG TPA: long-chain fatty acid--CoA ligase [Bacteroides sp.]|nr:long-chain fatty acid--CoA ligase [Bacteroides sp.]